MLIMEGISVQVTFFCLNWIFSLAQVRLGVPTLHWGSSSSEFSFCPSFLEGAHIAGRISDLLGLWYLSDTDCLGSELHEFREKGLDTLFGCLDNTQTNFEGTSEGMVVKRTKYDKNKPSIYQVHLSQTNLIRKEKKKKKQTKSSMGFFRQGKCFRSNLSGLQQHFW